MAIISDHISHFLPDHFGFYFSKEFGFPWNTFSSLLFPSLRPTATGAQQREAGSAGQTAGPLEGARPPGSHLLPDGPDAGYPGGIPAEPAVPLPGSSSFWYSPTSHSTWVLTSFINVGFFVVFLEIRWIHKGGDEETGVGSFQRRGLRGESLCVRPIVH